VTPSESRLMDPHASALAIGIGRVAIGTAFAALPELGVRLLGTDAATARRVGWLSRMVAGRDIALGAGTIAATRNGNGAGWVLGGAFADAVDSAAVVMAMKQGRLRGPGAWLIAVGGPALTVLGLFQAGRLRRRA